MKWLLIECGCAECHWSGEEPLIGVTAFDSENAAKEYAEALNWVNSKNWRSHPQGGWHIVVGQGSVWVVSATSASAAIPWATIEERLDADTL